jgi:hypothetical protein
MPKPPAPENAYPHGETEEPESKVTRGNFEALARGLFRVTPEQLAAEEARQKAKKPSARASQKGRAVGGFLSHLRRVAASVG